MKQEFRLTRSRDFRRVKENGSVARNPLLVLVFARNEEKYSRAAVVASKKIGNAVVRNKVKRRVRASLDLIWRRVIPSWDLIFYARPVITKATYEEIQQAIGCLLTQTGLIDDEIKC